MELYHLRTFVTVAEEGHLTRAADRLHTSQPAVSAHIKALEEELGVTLFLRTPKGMTLTAAGELLRRQAQHALAAASEFLLEAKRLHKEVVGEVRLGLNADGAFLHVIELHSHLAQRHPRIGVTLTDSNSTDVLEDLRGGSLDAGFFFGEWHPAEIAAMRLQETELIVVGPVEWRDRLHDATLAQIAALPWVHTSERCPYYRAMSRVFDGQGLEPVRVVTAEQEAAVRSLVESGIGLGLVRRDEAEDLVHQGRCCRWPESFARIPLQFGYLSRREQDPLVEALRQAVTSVWAVGDAVAS